MAPTKLDHVGHEHPLILIEDFDSSIIAAPLVCYLCITPVIGLSPAYTCSLEHSPCSVFLHKRCAESPEHITHLMHPEHQLSLKRFFNHLLINSMKYQHVGNGIFCAACTCMLSFINSFVYICLICETDGMSSYKAANARHPFILCARCAIMESVLDHEGHEQHPLTLLCRSACFSCDACGTIAEDSGSYSCHICQYWIHSSCAASPRTIKVQIHEDDTLQLIYAIPDMYRRFIRHCPICRHEVKQMNWAYFCEESGYFVHINCAAKLLVSGKNVIEIEDDDRQTYQDLMQFPRPCTDSLLADLIAEHQSGKETDTNTILDAADSEKVGQVINHWSHPEHPLILLKEFTNADNSGGGDDDDDDDDYDESDASNHIDKMLVCNGCVQPISAASNQYYYGCTQCGFFLHITCANHSTLKSPARCIRNPEHTLKLNKCSLLLKFDRCKACCTHTTGFTYQCETCSTHIGICCYLAPNRLKHEYHKHPLVHRKTKFGKTCNACLESIGVESIGGEFEEYGCETCSDIQIHLSCAMSYPKKIYHKWDSHSILLIYPPIYYKGFRYCEICELEVNQEAWLYRCIECDQCFHPLCIRQHHHVKLGSTVDPSTHTLHPHTLLILKLIDKDKYPERLHESLICRVKYCQRYFLFDRKQVHFECAGCNFLACVTCLRSNFRVPIQVPTVKN